ncbi:MAG: tyrosine--tRNA ligase [Gemmatimonadetes bacterium]|nr:tyrosine--tRNA ligase [Gemmatimonadota bacterium]
MTDLFTDLEWRGFVQVNTPELKAHLARGPVTAYCGFDPTAPSLQVGNLMPLMLLAHLQHAGHRPIVLMGGGTGLIGDPSGKRAERPLLAGDQLAENLARQRAQVGRFLDFGAGAAGALLLDNAEWLVPLRLVNFLRDVGKHFTINIMMQKESVKARLEGGLSYTEFSYMLLQAYDYLHLYRAQHCTLQVGGSDQWGNITAGVELIRRVDGAEVHGLVAPLVTMASGLKFGKSEGGAIWLDPALTSPYRFYQFWLNTDDRDVVGHLKLFTFLSANEVGELGERQRRSAATREAQRVLAGTLTALVHGEDAVRSVVAASSVLFGDFDPRQADDRVFDILAQEVPTARATSTALSLVDTVVLAGLAKSKSEARRGIEQGGIYLNQQRVQDVDKQLAPADWIGGRHLLLRKGKKDYALVRVGA